MFDGHGLAISLPAREFTQVTVQASLFGLEELASASISDDLRTAVGLIVAAARSRNLPIVFIARPEIFTNSDTLVWLQGKLGSIADHLCISDGMAVRVIPGMRNHVFLYRLGIEASAQSFAQLLRRVPEFFTTMASQVNTAYAVKLGGRRIAPPSLVVPGTVDAGPARAHLYSFFLDRRSARISAERSIAAGQLDPHCLSGLSRIIYVPMTEVAAQSRMFADLVSAAVLRACFDASTGVILRLPRLASPLATLADRVATCVAGLCVARSNIPRVFVRNVAFCTEDLNPTLLQLEPTAIHCLAHESFDFWRHTPSFYSRCSSLTVHAPVTRRAERIGIQAVLHGLLGREPGLRWLPRDEDCFA